MFLFSCFDINGRRKSAANGQSIADVEGYMDKETYCRGSKRVCSWEIDICSSDCDGRGQYGVRLIQ